MTTTGRKGVSRRSLVVWAGGTFSAMVLPQPAVSASPAPRLLLATDAPSGIDPAGYLVSEKFDGVRALWDGTALRFRSGGVVAAPAWFTQALPRRALDGELWMQRGQFEPLVGAVRRHSPRDEDWRRISYRVFELPGAAGDFRARAHAIEQLVARTGFAQLAAVAQSTVADAVALQRRLDQVVRDGGEGLVMHRADAPYVTGRREVLLKLKPLHDMEAVVVGHVPGKGRLEGLMGALRVRTTNGARFLIGTGFTDAQRADPPPVGSVVTFTHRGFTGQGIPRFASYLRQHEPL